MAASCILAGVLERPNRVGMGCGKTQKRTGEGIRAMMMSSREVECPTIGGMPESRLEWHLDNYRRYMRSDRVTDGLPGRSMVCMGGAISASFQELVDVADMRCARAVDALVAGLVPSERAAINHVYLHAVFRFPRENLAELLGTARFKIGKGLVSRGFY